MASMDSVSDSSLCINDVLRDDELRCILGRLGSEKDKDVFGLVCKRWLHLQSTERKKLAARAGPHMLRQMAARFTRLLELDLSQSVSRSFYPGVTDSDLSVVANAFTCLRVLNLQNCKGITDIGLTTIGEGLPTLQSLDVSYCRILRDRGLSAVAKGCPDLRVLHLGRCRFITDATLEALSENCHNLEDLDLQGCTGITDKGLASLASGCKQIKHLDINKCNNVSDVGVSCLSKACSSSLKTLKLLDCHNIGDKTMISLAEFCNNLETLIIGNCPCVTDEAIKSLAASGRRNLKNLRMDWCLNISDSSVSCLLNQCRSLEALDIGCCEKVTDAAFQLISRDVVALNLKFLKVNNCPKITVTGIGILLGKCDCLEYLDVRSCPYVTKTRCDEAGLHFPECCQVNFNVRVGINERWVLLLSYVP